MGARRGFSLIEILIVLAIIGIISALVFPMLTSLQSGYERRRFIADVNRVAQIALQQAIMTRTVHRVVFDNKTRRAMVEREDNRGEENHFVPLNGVPGSSCAWPSTIAIKNFIVEGFDEMQRRVGRKTETMWFFVVPDGLSQRVTINAIDKDTVDAAGKPFPISLVLNPFTTQFKVYHEFQT